MKRYEESHAGKDAERLAMEEQQEIFADFWSLRDKIRYFN